LRLGRTIRRHGDAQRFARTREWRARRRKAACGAIPEKGDGFGWLRPPITRAPDGSCGVDDRVSRMVAL